MKVHYLQHIEYENPANINDWLRKQGHKISCTRLYKNEKFPDLLDFDWLIIMGGPMNVYEHKQYPWLITEKKFIKKTIKAGKTILGICLGSQLLSASMGGKVVPNKHKEIGFYPVNLTTKGKESVMFKGVDNSFTAMHLHGDTFSIPKKCKKLASSLGCKNQAFEFEGRVFGMQFHFEYSKHHMEEFFDIPQNNPLPGKFVQMPEVILKNKRGYAEINKIMNKILFNVERSIK